MYMSFVVCILEKERREERDICTQGRGRGRGTGRGMPVSSLVRRRPQKPLESNTGIINSETMGIYSDASTYNKTCFITYR